MSTPMAITSISTPMELKSMVTKSKKCCCLGREVYNKDEGLFCLLNGKLRFKLRRLSIC